MVISKCVSCLKSVFTLTLLYCPFRLIHEHKRRDLSHEPITADHNQSYPIISRWRHCLPSRDFPPFILNYPPLNPAQALGGLLKLNGLRGVTTDSCCNFTCSFIHFLMFYFVILVLLYIFLLQNFFSSNFYEETLYEETPRVQMI